MLPGMPNRGRRGRPARPGKPRPAATPRVKLMCDYAAGWPLWSADEGLLSPDALPLSPALAADLRAWQELFDREFHWDGGWRSREAEVAYAYGAPELLHRLRRELGDATPVTLDAWPVTDPELTAWLAHRL
jgi:hypothetical protein